MKFTRFAGWLGLAVVLIAYAAVSFEFIGSDGAPRHCVLGKARIPTSDHIRCLDSNIAIRIALSESRNILKGEIISRSHDDTQ
jgi:hypothetical protein